MVCLVCFCVPHQYERWLLFPTVCKTKRLAFRFVAFFLICGMISLQISIFKWYSKQGYLKVTENTYPFRISRDKLLYVTFAKLTRLSGRLKQATREESRLCLFKWTRKEFGETATYPTLRSSTFSGGREGVFSGCHKSFKNETHIILH